VFRNIIDNIPHAVYFKDKKGRFIWVSKIYGTTHGAVIGKTDFDLYPEDEAREATEDDKRVMETGEPIIDKEERFTAPDGSELHILTTKAPLFDRDGDIIGIVGIARDITQQKKS
jgi:PAS domain S-box-containing protein